MYIIKNICDLRRLKLADSISRELAEHFARKLNHLKDILEPELDLEDFSLEFHGLFGVLEESDKDLTAIGLPESLAQIMPEWVSRLEVGGEQYYVLYILADNDYVNQVYLPDTIMPEIMRLWLSEQPIEEENSDEGEVTDQPF